MKRKNCDSSLKNVLLFHRINVNSKLVCKNNRKLEKKYYKTLYIFHATLCIFFYLSGIKLHEHRCQLSKTSL